MGTKQQNVDVLLALGFTVEVDQGPEDGIFLDSPKNDPVYDMPVIQAYVYPNQAGTWSVDLDGGFKAPAFANEELLIKQLDQYYPAWR